MINKNKKQTEKLKCLNCKKEKNKKTDYYNSKSKLYSELGKAPICKTCLKSMINYEDMNSIYSVLQQLDVMFDIEYWNKAIESKNDTFGKYITMTNSLHQFVGTGWKDSVFEKKTTTVEDNFINTNNSVSDELIIKFGRGYTNEQYVQMEKFYDEMIHSRKIDTPEHKKLLIIMCRLQTKIDTALENNDITTFEKLHKQYQDLIKNSGFRPIDKTASDVASGIRTFSQIFAEIEKDGFIKPAPINYEQDIVDKSIQYLLNYQLKLLNQQTLVEPPIDTPKVDDVNE